MLGNSGFSGVNIKLYTSLFSPGLALSQCSLNFWHVIDFSKYLISLWSLIQKLGYWDCTVMASYLMSLMILLTGSSAVSFSSCFTFCYSGAGKLTKAAKSFRKSPLLWNWEKAVCWELDMLTGPPSTTSVPLSTARKMLFTFDEKFRDPVGFPSFPVGSSIIQPAKSKKNEGPPWLIHEGGLSECPCHLY